MALIISPAKVISLDDVGDVNIVSNTDGEILRWNGSDWINNTLAEANILPASGGTISGNITANSYNLPNSFGSITTTSGVLNSVISQAYSVSAQEAAPIDIFFSSNGTKMFVLGDAGDDVTQYTLSVGWDLSSTITHDGQFSISTQTTASTGFCFSSDGVYLYVLSATTIYRYNLTTAWQITSGVSFSQSRSVSGQDTGMRGIRFTSDGFKMFLVGNTNLAVYQYTLSTAWDISTATYNGAFDPPSTYHSNMTSLEFNSTGTKLWIHDINLYAILEYDLATPWVVTSGVTLNGYFFSYAAGINQNSIYKLSYYTNFVSGIFVNESANSLFLIDDNDGVVKFNVNNIPLLSGKGWHVEGDLQVKANVVAGRNLHVFGEITGSYISFQQGYGYFGGISCSNVNALSGTEVNLYPYHSGNMTIGGAALTGTITFDQSTRTHTLNIANGATIASNTKTVNIGTSNSSNATSTTNINIGTGDGGSTNLILGSAAGVLYLNTAATTASILMGGASQTGSIILGRSTSSNTLSISSGAMPASTTKTVNIATGASLANSNTTVNIGTGSSGNVTINIGSTSTSSTTITGNLTVTGTVSGAVGTFEDALYIDMQQNYGGF